MAKTKNKNDLKNGHVKKNNTSGKTTKKIANKKGLVIDTEIKKEIKEVELVKKPTKKKVINTDTKIINKEKNIRVLKELTSEEIALQKKERNRKKYENKQKKYQDNKKVKPKKKIVLDEEIIENEAKLVDIKEEDLIKKNKDKEIKKKEKKKEEERKEKRKFNHKSVHFTQTLVNIREKGVSTINSVKEKTDDRKIPVGKTKEEKKQRFKRIIREAIVYAIILTIINILCILIFDKFNYLRLFDVKALNIVITIIVSLIYNFFITFMIDYFITEIWLRKKRKKEDGVQNEDNRVDEGEYQEDITNKE